MKNRIDSLLPTEHYYGDKVVKAFVREQSAGHNSGRILDVGCGTSPFRKFFDGMEYTGVDKYVERDDVVQADAHDLPFDDDSFDAVLCTEVIEHTEEPKAVLREIRRVLKPGGEIILTAPQTWCLHYEPNDYYRYTKYGLRYLLEDAGFAVEDVEQFGNLCQITAARSIDAFYELFDPLTKSRFRAVRFPAKFGLRALLAPFNYLTYYGGNLLPQGKDAFGWGIVATEKGET